MSLADLVPDEELHGIADGLLAARTLGASIEIRCGLTSDDLLSVLIYIGYLRNRALESGVWPDHVIVHGVDTVPDATGRAETFVRAAVYAGGVEVVP